ncbi:hypothetical protein [uncultured Umboniibacter sp.]|uniref:hypothetical protein n=1 Tax=uncultured Umboniibacter sp. TaxID=1798917 RepID=UPI002627E172|nr:hypothetical protein [uncultured Umboniibacter sp.]
MSFQTESVIVACSNASGEADMFVATGIEVTYEQYQVGIHYDLAKEMAADEGYGGPMVCFDKNEVANIDRVMSEINGDSMEFELFDAAEGEDAPSIKGRVDVCDVSGLWVHVEGYGNYSSKVGEGYVACIELYDGELNARLYNDINVDDPTLVSLEDAKERTKESSIYLLSPKGYCFVLHCPEYIGERLLASALTSFGVFTDREALLRHYLNENGVEAIPFEVRQSLDYDDLRFEFSGVNEVSDEPFPFPSWSALCDFISGFEM